MTISKRKLTKWRKEALKNIKMMTDMQKKDNTNFSPRAVATLLRDDKILQMTQELLDQHLLKEK